MLLNRDEIFHLSSTYLCDFKSIDYDDCHHLFKSYTTVYFKN